MMTKLLFGVTVAVVGTGGYFGLRQGASMTLRQDEPRVYWPRSNVIFLGSWHSGRGYMVHAGRADYESFAGGGPARGAK